MHNLEGQTIKGYDLQERIGAGGFGAVYRAVQSTVGREVAVKIILPGLANQPDFIRRFESEAHLIARLEHPFIVPLYDYWRDPDGAYLVMRWLRGGSLHNMLKTQGAFSVEDTVVMMEQITQALHTAHRSQVIHRDIKPANILLDDDGNAYLADFGIAKDHTIAHGVTEADTVIGSPDYLAPEQARSESVTPRTDIYSLGVVLYEMLTGEHPFPKISPIEQLFKHLNQPLPDITSLDDNIRDGLNTVIQKATAKNPQERFQDVQEFAQSLRAAAQLGTSEVTPSLVELLTPREQEVLQLMIDGKSNREIADALVVEVATVKWYNKQIYRKLNVRSRVQAIIKARELELVLGKSGGANTSTGHLPEPENPYKGLRAFQAADAQDFFGREKLVQKLIHRLQEDVQYKRFLAIVGPSGSGKSSVVRAGLIPALWRGELKGSDKWYIVDMLPGDVPLDELEVALLRVAGDHSLSIREHLERDTHGLIRAASLILPDDGSELLLVIDQFEEVFTLVENEASRRHFLNLLLEAVTRERSRVRVIVTLRADYYDRPLQYPEIGELLRSRVETVLPLGASELERAIREPALMEGVQFEDGLVSRIVADVNYQPGGLPLLQYALTELFERRKGRTLTQAAYVELGGTGGALAKRADELYLERDEVGREQIRQLFLRLVTLGEGAEDTRRRVLRSELLNIALPSSLPYRNGGGDARATEGVEVMDDIIDTYAASRLLALDHDPATRQPTVEVAHEAILREWDRLRAWLNESREDIRQQRIVSQSAEAWTANQHDTSYLLSGTRLEQMEKWHQATELALTPLEREFIETSITERTIHHKAETERQAREIRLEQRSRRILRGLVAVLLLATLGAFGLTSLAVRNANESQTNFLTSERIRFAAQSQIALERGEAAELPALLALRSLQLHYSPEADAALLQALSRGFSRQLYYGHTDEVLDAAFSSDGRFIASISADNTARLWDTQTGQEIRQFVGHTDNPYTIAFSQDDTNLITAATDYTVRIWDIATGSEIQHFRIEDVWMAIPSPHGRYIMIGYVDGRVALLDSQTGTIIREFVGHTDLITYASFTRDSRYVLTTSNDQSARLWDVESGQQVRLFLAHTDAVNGAEIASNGQFALTVSADNTARLWNIATGNEIQRLIGHTDWLLDGRISPDNRYALTSSSDKTARLWDVATGRELRQFIGHTSRIAPVRFSPDGQYVLTGSADRTMRLWDVEAITEPRVFVRTEFTHNAQPHFVGLSGETITIIARDSLFIRRDVESGETIQEIQLGVGFLNDSDLSPDDQLAAIVNGDGRLMLWNIQNGTEIFQTTAHAAPINRVRFAPDGQSILTASDDQTAKLWSLEGELLQEFIGHEDGLWAIAFSPDGQQILTGSSDQTARIWNIDTGEQIQQFAGHTGIVRSVDFSPDGNQILTGSSDQTARLWDAQSGRELQSFTGHTAEIASVKFSPDGQAILTASVDQTARIWDIHTGMVLRQFIGHTGGVFIARFSEDGQFVITGDFATVYLWRADLTELIEFTCSRLPRDFTDAERMLYNITDNQPTCPQFQNSAQTVLAEPTWTAVVPQPTPVWTPIPLEPVSEIIEFTFLGDLQNYEDFAMPALDVYQADGKDFVSRIPKLDEVTRQIPLYAANEPVPGDFVPPFDLGPWSQGTPLGFTLSEWVSAEGHGTFTVQNGSARLEMIFDHLIPNGIYTLWCNEAAIVPQFTIIHEAPCGNPDGSESVFVADASGHAEFSVETNILPPFTDEHVLDVAVAYHSDGQTYGARPGEFGKNVHVQLFYDFLPAGSE